MSVGQFISLLGPLLAPNKLILSNQNGTRPPKPYATISVRSIVPFRPQEGPPSESGSANISQQQLNTVEIEVFGGNASDLAENLAMRLRFPTTQDKAANLDIGIARIAQVMRVPELLDTSQFEERAILTFTAYTTLGAVDDVGVIETVEIDSSIDGLEHTCSITVPNNNLAED